MYERVQITTTKYWCPGKVIEFVPIAIGSKGNMLKDFCGIHKKGASHRASEMGKPYLSKIIKDSQGNYRIVHSKELNESIKKHAFFIWICSRRNQKNNWLI
jgi:hypothetical protein